MIPLQEKDSMDLYSSCYSYDNTIPARELFQIKNLFGFYKRAMLPKDN